jgi:hypothetical protein
MAFTSANREREKIEQCSIRVLRAPFRRTLMPNRINQYRKALAGRKIEKLIFLAAELLDEKRNRSWIA